MEYNIELSGMLCPWEASSKGVRAELALLKGKPVNVRINSLGGYLSEGLDIRQQFIDHGDVTAHIYGFTASAATIASLGAKRVCMSRYAFYLVHKVSNCISVYDQMNADDMGELIEQLNKNKLENEKMDLALAQIYATKCGKSVDEILDVLTKEVWLTAEEALSYGFIDEIIEDGEKSNASQFASKFNALGYPMPSSASNPPETRDAFARKILGFFDKLFKEQEAKQEPINSIITMATKYTHVNALLEVESITENNGHVQLTPEQMATIDARIASLEDDVTAHQSTIADLTSQVESLNASAGDSTTNVVSTATSSQEDEFAYLADAKALFDSLND